MADFAKPTLNRTATTLPEAPVEAPSAPPVRRVFPSQGRGPRRTSSAVGLGAAVVVIALIIWALVARRASKNAAEGEAAIRTAVVERRDFVRALRIAGTVQAVRSYPILVPEIAGSRSDQLVLTKLAPAGTYVKQGDVLSEFDRQGQIQDYMDRSAEYHDLADQVAKKESDEAAARAKDDTELKQAEHELDKDKLELQKEPILSRLDVKKNRLNVEAAEANLKQLRFTYSLKRQAAQADIHDLEIQRDAKQAAMLHAQGNEAKLVIHSPTDGIVVLNSIWKSGGMGEVQEGDEVWTGYFFMQIVDTDKMEVRASVNQMDAPYLHVGQPVEVHLDAYPGATFSGRVEQLSPLALKSQYSDKLWQLSAVFSIDQSDPKLMPNLSAAVDVELDRQAKALVVPRDSVFTEKGQAYVRVKRSAGSDKRAVTLGPTSDTEAVIESGVQAGEVVERNAGGA